MAKCEQSTSAAAATALVLDALVAMPDDDLVMSAYQRGYLAGAATALRIVAEHDHKAAPDHDGQGRR